MIFNLSNETTQKVAETSKAWKYGQGEVTFAFLGSFSISLVTFTLFIRRKGIGLVAIAEKKENCRKVSQESLTKKKLVAATLQSQRLKRRQTTLQSKR